MARIVKQTETKPQKCNVVTTNKINTNQTEIIFYYPEDIPIEDSLNNPESCFDPIEFYHQACNGCLYELGCIYRDKYKYRKINM